MKKFHLLILLNLTTIVIKAQNNSDIINIFQNPIAGTFTLDLSKLENQNVEIKIYNSLKQTICKTSCESSSEIKFDLPIETNEIYLVEVKAENKSIYQKTITTQR
jgi:hypothetical protein